MTLDEISLRHRGKWVLMQVTDFDDVGRPLRGRVIAAVTNRKDIPAKLAILPPSSKDFDNPGPYYTFHAGPQAGQKFVNALLRLSGVSNSHLNADRRA